MLWIYEIPLWVLGALLVAPLLLALELGFRGGARAYRAGGEARQAPGSDTTLSAMLTLLALMLAFTYAFSLSRADMRKKAVIAEANAIGTAFLRADLAPEPVRGELRKRLYEYAKTRVVSADMAKNREELRAVIARSWAAQAKIWPETKRAVESGMAGPQAASLVQAVNEVLDADMVRNAATYDRLPGAVLILLVFIAMVSIASAAHKTALRGGTSRARLTLFVLVLSALVFLILDFDIMVRGFVQVPQHSLVFLVKSMESALG